MSQPRAKRRRGLSLIEMLVVTGLMSAISLFTMVLYTTAVGDFESSTTETAMVRYARKTAQRVSQVLATAANRSETEATFADTTADNKALGTGSDPFSDVNFLSTANYIKSSLVECAYAFDEGDVNTPGYTNLFRYQLGWTGPTGRGNIPPNCIYLERRTINYNASGIPVDNRGLLMPNTYRQNLGNNIGNCKFQLVFGNTMQMRLTVYSVDPVTGRGIDGQLMRTTAKRRRKDAATGEDKTFELITAVPIPTVSIK